MTVHRAKGLEFPVVILCDPTAQASSVHPSRHVEPEKGLWVEPIAGCAPRELLEHRDDAIRRDSEEAVRVAYVAATRARDLLVVPVVGDAPLPGWLEVLHPAIYPNDEERRRGGESPGCPLFGTDSVLERPQEARRGSEASVCPGLHLPQAGSHSVVWWDPAALKLDAQVDTGIRQQRILHPDDGPSAQATQALHQRWIEARQDRVLKSGRPTARVGIATDYQGEEVGATLRMESTSAQRSGRPGGKRFGTLVHALLSVVDLKAPPAQIRSLAVTQGRMVGGTPEEVAAACSAVEVALRHPLLLRAGTALEVRREAPVTWRTPEGELIEGVIDFAFREATGWTVIDFKTDRELEEESRARYQLQLALYVRAVAQASRLPAVGVLLSV
jgi:ATP-dependent exoDNAse (exonuclease V) beta subunit